MSRSSFIRGFRPTLGSNYGPAESRVRLTAAVVTSSAGRTVPKWASCSGTCLHARSLRKPTFGDDGCKQYGETMRPTSRTSRLRGSLCATGHARTTNELRQRSRSKSYVGTRPRCGPHCASGGRHVTVVADALAEERNGTAGTCWWPEGRQSEQTLSCASCDSGEVRTGACVVAKGTP